MDGIVFLRLGWRVTWLTLVFLQSRPPRVPEELADHAYRDRVLYGDCCVCKMFQSCVGVPKHQVRSRRSWQSSTIQDHNRSNPQPLLSCWTSNCSLACLRLFGYVLASGSPFLTIGLFDPIASSMVSSCNHALWTMYSNTSDYERSRAYRHFQQHGTASTR